MEYRLLELDESTELRRLWQAANTRPHWKNSARIMTVAGGSTGNLLAPQTYKSLENGRSPTPLVMVRGFTADVAGAASELVDVRSAQRHRSFIATIELPSSTPI